MPLPGRIQLAPGDDLELTARAWSGVTRLLGDVAATFRLSGDSAVATILDGGRPSSRRLRIKKEGVVTLTIESTPFEKTLTIEVLP